MRTILPLESEVYLRQAEKALRGQCHLRQYPVRLQCTETGLQLDGEVSSFYEKQMAQEALRQFDAQIAIDNQLEVSWS